MKINLCKMLIQEYKYQSNKQNPKYVIDSIFFSPLDLELDQVNSILPIWSTVSRHSFSRILVLQRLLSAESKLRTYFDPIFLIDPPVTVTPSIKHLPSKISLDWIWIANLVKNPQISPWSWRKTQMDLSWKTTQRIFNLICLHQNLIGRYQAISRWHPNKILYV